MWVSVIARSMAAGGWAVWLREDLAKRDGFKVSFCSVLQHSLNPSVTLLNWVKVYNVVCTPKP